MAGNRVKLVWDEKEQGNKYRPQSWLDFGELDILCLWSNKAFTGTRELPKFRFADKAPQAGMAPSQAKKFISIPLSLRIIWNNSNYLTLSLFSFLS